MSKVVLYALTSALYPTLLAAATVMLMLDHPKRLLFGYLLGALMTSITLGLVIVFSLQDSGAPDTAKNTLSPALDLALGAIALAVAYALRPSHSEEPKPEGRIGRIRRERKEAKEAKREEKGPPKWQQTLNKGSARTTFVMGAILTLPGGSYILGLHAIADQDLGNAATVGLVLAFNAVMLILLELPLIAYTVAPDWTPDAVERFKDWLSRNSRRIGVRVALVLGLLMIARGVIGLL